MKVLAFTDHQLAMILRGAALLPTHGRDTFLHSVASRLSDNAHPNDNEVEAAVNFILSFRGVACGRVVLCDGVPKREKTYAKTQRR
jgi:hypothetical protein